jgi:hypothetical protein
MHLKVARPAMRPEWTPCFPRLWFPVLGGLAGGNCCLMLPCQRPCQEPGQGLHSSESILNGPSVRGPDFSAALVLAGGLGRGYCVTECCTGRPPSALLGVLGFFNQQVGSDVSTGDPEVNKAT